MVDDVTADKFDFKTPPSEVALSDAPLVRVLSRISFTPVPELLDDAIERALAERLLGYPVRGQTSGLSISLPVPAIPVAEMFRTFEESEGDWKVTIGKDFVVLETTSYDRRPAFVERLCGVLKALESVLRPPRVTRIGVRFIDRIENPQDLVTLVRAPLSGWLGHIAAPDTVLEHQIVQVQLRVPESPYKVQAKSLLLPAGVLVDPAIPPSTGQSWWLDLDAFDDSARSFDGDALAATVSDLAQHAYSLFHWGVTDEFRAKFGGVSEDGATA